MEISFIIYIVYLVGFMVTLAIASVVQIRDRGWTLYIDRVGETARSLLLATFWPVVAVFVAAMGFVRLIEIAEDWYTARHNKG